MLNNNEIERLFKSHYAQMHRAARMLLHDDDMARDIVHDVFSALIDRPSDVMVDGGYLFNSVRNRCLNYIRDLENRERIHRLYLLEVDRYRDDCWTDADDASGLLELIDSELPGQCRKVTSMFYREGMTTAEIAGTLGISVSAVYKSLNRAIGIFRKRLKENG